MVPHVLIVDDDLGTRDTFSAILRLAGFAVTTCTSAGQAIDTLQSGQLDAILADLRLPDMTGVQLLQRLTSTGHYTPLTIMTAYATIESATEAIRFGAVDYVEKPLSDERVVTVVRHLCSRVATSTPGLPAKAREGERLLTATSHSNRRILDALDFIERNYADHSLNLKAVARQVNLSPEYLCRLLKRTTGDGFRSHLRRIRTNEACRLLVDSHLSVKQIAFLTGYSTATLDYQFKRLFGLLPTQFRKECQNKAK